MLLFSKITVEKQSLKVYKGFELKFVQKHALFGCENFLDVLVDIC